MYRIHVLFLFMLLTTQLGCRKRPSAGLGGNAILHLYARHHALPIDSITFYVKFNSSDAPADGNYDLSQKAEVVTPGNAYATINGLKKGDYYLFAQGWDTTINQTVRGGIPYTISDENEQSVIVPVTE